MAELGEQAARHIRELRDHYEAKERPEAAINLIAAVRRVMERIDRDPGAGLPWPRPYPELAHPGELWVKEGRYWFAYSATIPPIVLAVFYDQADIPRRRR